MNSYLGRDEKENLIRLMILKVQLEKVLEIYSTLKSIDKAFLADLRHSKTRLHKATEVRLSYLDNEAKANLMLAIAKLNIAFLPTPEAKKANKEKLELQSTLPMDVEDLQDWYGFVIESTCKACTRADYEECPARQVLSKYEICPMDPGAKDKCQYSYVGAPEAEELQPVDTDKTVPALVYNAALAMVKAKEDSIIENYVPAIKQLQAEVEELNKEISATKEQIESLQEKNAQYIERNQELYAEIRDYEKFKSEIVDILYSDSDDLSALNEHDIVTAVREMDVECDSLLALKVELTKDYNALTKQFKSLYQNNNCDKEDVAHEGDSLPVFIGFKNGNKLELLLPENMANKLIEEIQRPRLSRSICARYVDGEFVAIDLQEVVAMRVSGLPDGNWVKPQPSAPAYESTSEHERYRIECKCGTEYFATMNAGRAKANCRDCKYTVFADRQATPSDGSEATLLTNRYFVSSEPREPQQPVQDRVPVISNNIPSKRVIQAVSELQDIKNTNHGRGYKDPCQLFG